MSGHRTLDAASRCRLRHDGILWCLLLLLFSHASAQFVHLYAYRRYAPLHYRVIITADKAMRGLHFIPRVLYVDISSRIS